MKERWKAIAGWEELYEVSDLGRVRSLDRQVRARGGSTRTIRGKMMRPVLLGRSGCLRINLWRPGQSSWRPVHLLVLEAFGDACPPGMMARHRNGFLTDNRLENLTWGTRHERAKDAKAALAMRHREEPLTEEEQQAIRTSRASIESLSVAYRVSPLEIWAARSGRRPRRHSK